MAALWRFLLVPYLAAAACRSPTPAGPSLRAEVRATVLPNPSNAIGALVEVVASGGFEVWVEHGETPAYGERTRAVPVPPGGKLVIPTIGLAPAAPNHFRVHLHGSDGANAQTDDIVFQTGPLPAGVPPSLTIVKSSSRTTGFVLVGLYDEEGETLVATMIDRRGRTRWYWVAPPPVRAAAEFARVHRNFLVADCNKATFYEIDLAGQVVKSWRDTASAHGLDGHDFFLLPSGNAMMFGWEFRAVDSRPFFAKGRKTSIRADHTVDEIDPSGNVKFHWSSYDHVGLDEVIEGPDFDPTNFHVVHINSIEVLPDDNFLVSFRSTSSIMKIDRSNGNVMWRLGGKKSDFTFVDDSSSGFSRQHDPRLLRTGELMLFDNGDPITRRFSRVVRYKLDELNNTAKLTWEYRHDPDVFCAIAGSARALPNGNVLIGWAGGLVTEIDESKNVVWEAATGKLALYRALWTPSLYP